MRTPILRSSLAALALTPAHGAAEHRHLTVITVMPRANHRYLTVITVSAAPDRRHLTVKTVFPRTNHRHLTVITVIAGMNHRHLTVKTVEMSAGALPRATPVDPETPLPAALPPSAAPFAQW
jgi:hypothetical protein